MLTGRPSYGEIQATVHAAIVELLERAERPVPRFDDDADLVSTGLRSLDLAALVAKLTRRWRVDPFLEALAITEVRTVGDLCRAYRDCLAAE